MLSIHRFNFYMTFCSAWVGRNIVNFYERIYQSNKRWYFC